MDLLRITVTSAFGVEGLLRREMNRLGYVDGLAAGKGGVTFAGDWLDLARCNVMIRQGERVMAEVGSFPAATFDALFEGTKALPWEDWLCRDAAFPVTGKSVQSALFSVPDCQAIIKKAIVERLKQRRHQTGRLSETGPLYQVMFKITQDQATIGLNASGDGLHKRGWRKLGAQAPLKETLASVMLTLSNWRPDLPLADPFCGSGTILIEAVRKALCMAPGLGRNFAAEAWPQMPADCWRQAREEALSAIRVAPDLRVEGYDIDPDVLSMARYHAKLAGVEEHIHFQCRDIRDFRSAKKYGAIITNPAYGERMGDAGEAARLYGIMGRVLAPLDTWSFYVLSAHPSFEEAFGRPAAKRTKLFNGKLECRLYQYHGPRPPRRELVENGARRI